MWILYLIILILLCSLAYAGAQGAPWVPTWKKDLERINRLIDLKPGEKMIELGCGNGRVTRFVASRAKQSEVFGLELSLIQFIVAWSQTKLSNQKNAKIIFGNVFKRDLSKFDAVYMFLMPETYEKIKPKLESELKKGSRVVTYVWPIIGWQPKKVDVAEGSQKIYLYKL